MGNVHPLLTNADLTEAAIDAGRIPSRKPALDVVCMADVKAKPIEWLWDNWIAFGKVSVLAGEGGQGKSTVLCDLAARTSTGEMWPDGTRNGRGPRGVVILAAEDDCEDTIAPRLIAAGADMTRIFNIRSVIEDNSRRSFNLQADLARLEQEIAKRPDIGLVQLDPVTSYLGRVDSHKNADVRAVLEPLGELAARLKVAIVCNNHFTKGLGGTANNRIIGSVAFVNQARAAFIVTPDAEDDGRMLLMPSKNNIAPIKYGLAYRIEGVMIGDAQGLDTEILTSRIAWESLPVTISADEALAAHAGGNEAKTAKAEAIDFLRAALAGGSKSAAEIQAEAKARDITPKSLRSARQALGVKTDKASFGGGWVWTLPKMPSGPEDALLKNRAPSALEGTFGGQDGAQ
jgi:putative DNA primase/helicase